MTEHKDVVIGIDLGTSATKACAFTVSGQLLAESAASVVLSHPRAGWAEQPAAVLVESALEALAAVARRIEVDCVAAIGLTGQMGGLVLVDGDGLAVTPHQSWLDTRAAPIAEEISPDDQRRLVARCGAPAYLAPKAVWWQREHPEVFQRTRSIVSPVGYAALALSAGDAGNATIDWSSSGFFGLYDIKTGQIDYDLCSLWGLEPSLVPHVVPCGEVIGRLSPGCAELSGLLSGTPIVCAPFDGPAGWLGVGAVEPGCTVDTSGTSNHIGICGERFSPDLERQVLVCIPSGVTGLWHLQGYTNGTGLTHRWYVDAFPPPGAGESTAQRLVALERLAADVPPGSDGVVCVPHFGGRVCPLDPTVSGAWVGVLWRHRSEHLYRALLESVAYEYACYFEAAERVDPTCRPREVRVIGGGAASGLWTRIKADVLGIPFIVMEPRNHTCWGAALAAAFGAGLLDNLADAAQQSSQIREVVDPDSSNAEIYGARLQVYKQLFSALSPTNTTLWQERAHTQGAAEVPPDDVEVSG